MQDAKCGSDIPGTLRKRFERFVHTVPGVEHIDDLLRETDPPGMQRADYLLHGRSVIVEQKTLEADPREKGQRFMDQVMRERNIVAYGRLPANRILEGQPDAEALNRQLYLKLTQVIEGVVSKADKQTRDTRDIFDLKGVAEAGGLLVILNEGAITLDPEAVCHRVARLVSSRLANGKLRYPHNQVVLYLQESHALAGRASELIPAVTIRGPEWTSSLQVESVARRILRGWAAFNGRPLVVAPDNSTVLRCRSRGQNVRPVEANLKS